jgi:SAM-dependent methyltransferase
VYPGRAVGTQVVRYYWNRFLEERRMDIRGRALEIGVTGTVRHFGGDRLASAEAIDVSASDASVTIVADLTKAGHVPSDQFDCFVNQFTMHIIYDFRAALYHSIRILKPGGVLLINFPCRSGYPVNGIPLGGGQSAHVYWWFTPCLVEAVLAELGIDERHRLLQTYGNYFALAAYMAGIPSEELTKRELETVDPDFPLLICARLQKPQQWSTRYQPGS